MTLVVRTRELPRGVSPYYRFWREDIRRSPGNIRWIPYALCLVMWRVSILFC